MVDFSIVRIQEVVISNRKQQTTSLPRAEKGESGEKPRPKKLLKFGIYMGSQKKHTTRPMTSKLVQEFAQTKKPSKVYQQ